MTIKESGRMMKRAMVLAAALSVSTTGGLSAQSAIERALERAGAAVERAWEGMTRAVDRAFDRGNLDASVSQAATDFRWTGRLAEGAILEIKGINGEIEVERAAGAEVEVFAETRARRSDPTAVRIERVEHDEGITFCAVYPSQRDREENYCAPGSSGRMNVRDNDTQVDFRIRLPAGVRFAGRNVNGDIEAFGLRSDVVLTTVNGSVDVETTGYAEASTVNGSIDARMGRIDPDGGLSFKTVNGSVTLDLPDDLDADLDARWLNGGLDSDLAFTLEGRTRRGRAEGRFGRGGPPLSISTVNGSIRIR